MDKAFIFKYELNYEFFISFYKMAQSYLNQKKLNIDLVVLNQKKHNYLINCVFWIKI